MITIKRPIPNSAALCIGVLFGLLVGALFVSLFIVTNMNRLSQSYGEVLAKTSAQRSIDSTFKQDLIGLRAIMKDTSEFPFVRIASTHDVENHLLAQAGDFPYFPMTHDQSFTAPITLQDNIAGYVTVITSIAPKVKVSPAISLGLLSLLLVFIIVIILYKSNALIINIRILKSFRAHKTYKEQTNLSYHDEPFNKNKGDDVHISPVFYAYAVIQIKNIHTVKQQLNGETYRALLSKTANTVEDVLRLYGGLEFEWKDNYYTLKVASKESQSEAVFLSICCAYLISELIQVVNNIPLEISSHISLAEYNSTVNRLAEQGLCIDEKTVKATNLEARLQLHEPHRGLHLVSDFKPPYKGLLENQQKQLS